MIFYIPNSECYLTASERLPTARGVAGGGKTGRRRVHSRVLVSAGNEYGTSKRTGRRLEGDRKERIRRRI